MTDIAVADSPFREGDEVVLAMGSHPGALGVFLRLKEDVKWAEIRERNGDVRSHPVVWLAHAPKVTDASITATITAGSILVNFTRPGKDTDE